MHAYLTRLGIRPEIQQFFSPYYHNNENGNLCFSYGSLTEIYGLAYHVVPAGTAYWATGSENLVRRVIICSSAMEAIAWLNCNSGLLTIGDGLRFIAIGNSLDERHLMRLRKPKFFRNYTLLFSRDLIGNVFDLKAASALEGYQSSIFISAEIVNIEFRNRRYQIPCKDFSLSSFERLSGFRFKAKTLKPRQHVSWLNQLEAQSFTI